MVRSIVTLFCVVALLPSLGFAESGDSSSGTVTGVVLNGSAPQRSARPSAAIFVQNHAGEELDSQVPMFRDLLTSRLTEKGFAIMDGHDIAERFQETQGTQDPVVDILRDIAKGMDTAKTEASVEQVLNGASALRVAQMLGADYLIVASFASIGSDRKVFHGDGTLYKTGNEVFTRTLRTSLKVLEGNKGSTVYGDTVVSKLRLGGNEHLTTITDDGDNELIDSAAASIAENISSKVQRIKDTTVEGQSTINIEVKANVEGATVEVDGATIGSTPGTFAVRPGVHQVAISKERYVTWRRTINAVPNQVLNVTLERSGIGEDRNENTLRVAREDELIRKTTEAGIDIAKEQSSAHADAKRQVAEGEKEYRKNSYTQIEGAVNELNIGRSADALVKVERE